MKIAKMYDTVGLVSRSKSIDVAYGSSTSSSTVITVVVNAPNLGTWWNVNVGCGRPLGDSDGRNRVYGNGSTIGGLGGLE